MSIIVSVIVLLSIGLLATDLERRLRRQADALKASLQVTNEKLAAANAELRRLAFSDQLTGIANRMLFEDRLGHALARVDRRNMESTKDSPIKAALLFIDLDGFKPINDTLGHAAGDDVLQEVARRLRSTCRESDTVARIGGDEFVVLLEDVVDLAQGEEAADRIVQLMSQPFGLQTRQVSISCSIGLALYPDHGERDLLLASADAAMYVAKKDGGARYVAFRPHMLQATRTKARAAATGGVAVTT
jgi:diguanylate cyclase (GGDEF)-like protein